VNNHLIPSFLTSNSRKVILQVVHLILDLVVIVDNRGVMEMKYFVVNCIDTVQ